MVAITNLKLLHFLYPLLHQIVPKTWLLIMRASNQSKQQYSGYDLQVLVLIYRHNVFKGEEQAPVPLPYICTCKMPNMKIPPISPKKHLEFFRVQIISANFTLFK